MANGPQISISDDDICSDCLLLCYRPGGMSSCRIGWPVAWDENDYAVSCPEFRPVRVRHENVDEAWLGTAGVEDET